ncbi:MAG: DUF2059 domain-containing protein [Burkholderiales bacterium]
MMLKKSFRTWALLSLCAVAGAAPAQSSAAKKELIQKVLQLQQIGVEGFARTVVVEQPVSQMMQAAARALQAQPADKREAIGKSIEADARKYVEDVTPSVRKRAIELAPQTIGGVLDQSMSEDELKALITWLESPVSKKYGQLQPEMQRALGEKLVAEMRPTVEPKLKALEQSVAARLGVPAPASGAAPAPKK